MGMMVGEEGSVFGAWHLSPHYGGGGWLGWRGGAMESLVVGFGRRSGDKMAANLIVTAWRRRKVLPTVQSKRRI